jgi:DNA polymerase III subunit gamma/tau
VILENLVTFVGALLKHIIGVLLLCWRRMLRAGLIAFAIGAVVTVLVEVVGTGEAIPSVLSLIVALLFGLALAYGVALTVLVEELILGAIDLIRMIEGDVSAGAHIAEVVAEREVGQVGQGLRRLLGLPVSKRAPVRPGATLPPLMRAQAPGRPSASLAPQRAQPMRPQSAASPTKPPTSQRSAQPPSTQAPAQPQLSKPPTPAPSAQPSAQPPVHLPGSLAASSLLDVGAALAVKAAASAVIAAAAQHTTPAAPPASAAPASTAAEGEPVPADRLPRIEWTYEHEATLPPAAPGAGDPPTATPEAATPLAEATTPVTDAATPVSSPAPASDDLPRTLAELAGATSADAPSTPVGAPAAPGPAEPTARALEAPYDDERLAAPASVTMPEGPAEPAERPDETARDAAETTEVVSAEPVELAPEWSRAPSSASRVVVDAPAEPADGAAGAVEMAEPAEIASRAAEPAEIVVDTTQPPQDGAPASRSDSSRRTLPLSDTGASLDGPRPGVASGPRPSAPESGLWERLSSALISRSGAPSGPFASAPPSQPGDESAPDEVTSQQPEPDRDV